jgi:hypothetical protein
MRCCRNPVAGGRQRTGFKLEQAVQFLNGPEFYLQKQTKITKTQKDEFSSTGTFSRRAAPGANPFPFVSSLPSVYPIPVFGIMGRRGNTALP